jgi:hypothetical protein
MVSVAPASRRLFALSSNSYKAGKMPALPWHVAASVRRNFQPFSICSKGLEASNCVSTQFEGSLRVVCGSPSSRVWVWLYLFSLRSVHKERSP